MGKQRQRAAAAGEFDRRRLMLAAAGLMGGAALGVRPDTARASRQDGVDARREGISFRRALKLGMVAEGDTLLDKFRLLVDLGYDGVELDSPNTFDPDDVLAARDATGLAIPGVVDAWHWRYTLGDPDAAVRTKGREGLETALRDAALYGASTVLLVPAVVDARISYQDAYHRSREEIARVLPLAEELGVAIALENVWNHFLLSPLEAAAYVDSFGSPSIGWYLDPGNLVRHAWPTHWVHALGPRILKIDVKDYSRQKRDAEGLWRGFDVEIGAGDVDWPATVAALNEVGFPHRGQPWASAEVPGGDRTRLATILTQMDRALG